jgi:hypothetical protein
VLSASRYGLLRVRNIGADTVEKIMNWEKTTELF